MPVTKISPANSADFFEANKGAIAVLIFDADFSGQQEIVESATRLVQDSEHLKGKIVVGSVDVEANNDLATQFSVISVPMIVCVRDGKVLKKIDTLEPTKLEKIISEVIRMVKVVSGVEEADPSVDPKVAFREYLKKLTTRAPVMVFMKGEPNQPRCGFSRQLVELLGKHDISYKTFDILEDEEVRQGLKEYSDWPTYPQIYANGEFIGGLDILKQMEDSGELESTLKI